MEKDADFLGKYRAISNKLKKRFLKKPNVAEGSEQFASLAKVLKNQECPQYSGFCCLAQARCEHTLANAAGEAEALTQAARSFLEVEEGSQMLCCPSFEEHLNAAINCYSHAVRVHMENKQTPLAATLCWEVGNALKELNMPGEAIAHFQRAAELQLQNTLNCLESLSLAASCKIETRDYEGALAMFTDMAQIAQERAGIQFNGKPLGAYSEILAKCEISRVLLLMLLQPTPQRIRQEHAQTLEKYAWECLEETPPINYITEDVFLLLQSVVMACQSHDMESLRSLQIELWPMLSPEQNHLLHLVLEEISHPAGVGV